MRSRTAALLMTLAAFSGGCGGPSSTTPSGSGVTVYRQATVQLGQTFTLDLDTGTMPPGLAGGADIWFQAVSDQERYLSPVPSSGAVIAVTAERRRGSLAA